MFDMVNTFNFHFNFDFFKKKKKKNPISIKILKDNVETFNHELNLEEAFFFIIDDKLRFLHSNKLPPFAKKKSKNSITSIDDFFEENIANFYKSLIISRGLRIEKKMIVKIENDTYLLVIEPLLQAPKSYASMLCHIKYEDIELNSD